MSLSAQKRLSSFREFSLWLVLIFSLLGGQPIVFAENESNSSRSEASKSLDYVPVSPIDNRSWLGKFISLAPEPTSALTEMMARVAVADLQDLLEKDGRVEQISNQLTYELRDAQVERGPGFLAKVLRFYAEKGVSLKQLQTIIFKKTGGKPLEVKIPTHPTDMKAETSASVEKANQRLARVGFTFVKLVAVSEEKIQRSDLAYPEHEASRAKIEKIRNKFVPLLVFLSSASAGYLSSRGHSGLAFWLHMTPSLILGGLGYMAEWQFSKFSYWWNKNVWQRLDAAGPAIANATIPFLFFLAGWGAEVAVAHIGQSLGVETGFAKKSVLKLATDVATTFTAFMVSFGLTQTALARLTKSGELSEGPRYQIESPICMVANSGRSFGIAAPFLGVGSAELYSKIFGYIIQGAVALGVSAPAWVKLIYGDRAFDEATAQKFEAIEAQSGGKKGCPARLGIVGRLLGWSSHLQFSKR